MRNNKVIIGGRYQYNPSDLLNSTSMYEEYRALDKALSNRTMILNILNRQDRIMDKMRQIKHPFVTAVVDMLPLQNGKVAMLLQPGGQASIKDVLHNVRYIQEQDSVVIFKYILLAVKEIHSKLIVVNKLCCDNFIFSSPGIIKFGYRTFQEHLPLQFKAPQILKSEEPTYSSDIYSLGVIFYKMLYGCYPFEGNDESSILKQIKNKNVKTNNVQSPFKIVISRQIHYLLMSMLDYYPENRPSIQSILAGSYFDFHIETDTALIIKPKKGSIVPQSFHKKYLVFRATKVCHNIYNYYEQNSYMVLAIKQKNLMTLYSYEYKMYQADPRKIQSYYQKLKAIQEGYTDHGTQFICRIDDHQRFKQQPLVVTQYCNQGDLHQYLQKRKISEGWFNQKDVNLIMYLIAMGLKQYKQIGLTALHFMNDKRIMISNNSIKIRQPGIISPVLQKKLQSSETIDYFAPELKEPYEFVELNKTDMWSFGILYYYLLSAKMPTLNQQNLIEISVLKTNQKNKNLIGKCLDQKVDKRIFLDNVKIQNVDEQLLQIMLADKDTSDKRIDTQSEAQGNQDRRKVVFKNRKTKIFKDYNKIIAESSTSTCRVIIKILINLILLWILFFGLFFINGGIGLIRSNYYRPITLQVPYNFGTQLYNLTILTTNGAYIESQYTDYSYEKFTEILYCYQNNHTGIAKKTVDSFINNTHSVFCLFGFIFAILISVLYAVFTFKLDLPKLLVERADKKNNKNLYHFIFFHFLIPALMFCFFYIYALEYIIQDKPCLGITNPAFPEFTSVQALLTGNLSLYFVNVFLTVILWSILMLLYGFLSIFIRKINSLVFQWQLVIPTIVIMTIYTLICRIGFGGPTPIQPTWSYKINLDIVLNYFGFFGFFPEALYLVVFVIERIVDFLFWGCLRLGLQPDGQDDIDNVEFLKVRAQADGKQLDRSLANMNMVEQKWDFDLYN